MKTGIELIAEERKEQIEKHGRSIKSDVTKNSSKELSHATRMLAHPYADAFLTSRRPPGWDIKIWNKMLNKPYKERLIISGALIAAEIDRLLEIEKTEQI